MISLNETISKWRINRAIPRFIISNTNVLESIINIMKIEYLEIDYSIDSIRDMISYANTIKTPIIYHISCADKMSIAAQNSLLKVVEEPPNKSYFIMNISDESKILPTLRSRAVVINENIDNSDCIEYTNKIIECINKMSGVDLLNQCNRLRSKESETDKIDCITFYNTFKSNMYKINNLNVSHIISPLSHYIKYINHPTINKKALTESFLLTILNEVKHA